jgi:twitching motility protein PilJ
MLNKTSQSIQRKVVFPIVLGAMVVVGLSLAGMWYIKRQNTELTGLTIARAVTGQAVTLRTFYANEVVSRAHKAGMRTDVDYAAQENALPLPVTLMKVMGTEIQKLHPGSSIRLYSQYPFTHQGASLMPQDAFAQAALEAVTQDPRQPFYRMEEIDGHLSMRYATADVMRDSCVNCHNSHPQSPKTDWKVGDVRGVIEVVVPVDEAAAGLQANTMRLAGFIGGALVLLAIIVVLRLRRTVVKPVQALAATSMRVSDGDLDARAPVQSHDEIGALALGFNAILDQLTRMIATSQTERDQAKAAIQKLLDEVADVATGDLSVEAEVTTDATGAIADSFNYMVQQLRTLITQVQGVAFQVSTAAHEIYTTAEHLADGSTSQAAQILESSAALDEMAVSIRHVSESAVLSTSVAEQTLANAKQGARAVQYTIAAMQRMRQQVQEIATRVEVLGAHSQEIGTIVQLVGDIADRTGVLALNASIEAALAGEAGLGFAIVAREVERLAERATAATRQITGLVEAVQTETHAVVRAMEDSTHEVRQGTELADQAGKALQEIETVSMHLAELIQSISMASSQQARGSENLSKAMGDIAEVTQQVATGTKQAVVSINDLAGLAEVLQSSVSAFKLPANTDTQRFRA